MPQFKRRDKVAQTYCLAKKNWDPLLRKQWQDIKINGELSFKD